MNHQAVLAVSTTYLILLIAELMLVPRTAMDIWGMFMGSARHIFKLFLVIHFFMTVHFLMTRRARRK